MEKSKKYDRKDRDDRRDKNRKKNKRSDSEDSDDERRSKDHKITKRGRQDEDESTNNGGGEKTELSIEETNALRAKLGLKPLQIDKPADKQINNVSAEGNKIYRDKDTHQIFEHKPAASQTQVKVETKLREKLKDQREKRLYQEKLLTTKKIADEEEEDESAQSWIEKLKDIQKQKEEASKKAKLFEEMDNQYENEIQTNLTAKLKKSTKTKNYTSRDLAGLSIEHSQEVFKEGQEMILTLKDKNVLDEENDDTLVNVNVIDEERAKKNIENLKKKPTYKPYDDFDDNGIFQAKSILNKYDEEIDGEKKKSFKLGTGGVYSNEMDRFIEQQNEEYKSRAIKLDPNDFKIASDYRTKEEEALFKKPKKSKKDKLRSKTVKADDLIPLPEPESNVDVSSSKSSKVEESDKDSVRIETENTVSLKNIDFEMKPLRDDDSEDEYIPSDDVNNDYLNIKANDVALDELHETLNKIRNRTIRKNIDEIAQKIIEERDLNENNLNTDQSSLINCIEIASDVLTGLNNGAITIDSMSEFVRNLGESSTTSYRIDETKTKMDTSKKNDGDKSSSEDEFDTKNIEMDIDEEDQDQEHVAILDDEPVVDRGLASALKLAVNKGYLEQEKSKQNARLKGDISVKNYFVEEKNFYDIDDKHSRSKNISDRYTSGPISEFREKEGYKPDIKLEYVDEGGRRMNEKEAFRYLSHKFHGKGPGKTKTEKRIKKQKESELMNKMSSIDTPLNTVALLQEKQKKLQQPFVVLSAPKGGKVDQITLKKP